MALHIQFLVNDIRSLFIHICLHNMKQLFHCNVKEKQALLFRKAEKQKSRKAKNRRAKGQALRSRIAVIEKYERTYVKPQQTAPQ